MAVEARHASEERYRTIFEQSSDVNYITAVSGEIVAINQAGLNLFGFTREEMIGSKIQEIYVNVEDRATFRQIIEQEGAVRDYELKLRKKNGAVMQCLINATIWRDSAGNILGYQGSIRDVTERKRAEATVQELLKRTQLLYNISEARDQPDKPTSCF